MEGTDKQGKITKRKDRMIEVESEKTKKNVNLLKQKT